ncbi:MAG: thiamine pyrophosphate-dependent enzyme [Brevibacterium sp.]|uniref:thiamine pyrophosphate-binding protein n=1 Tax=Brevibacterium sp. TaxID=1701 RepID=UPI002648E6BF|nr:thiamine pyrophosphate-binding protein [Brevibacterium sp.]MDN5806078.1 thiamine pyrophosphate-dependent enzyme [Brevibacterium sp.]MDN5832613.1 thiamine pyrophosphate-dependent enzyme [Brevibacterium sp.]MDN5877146.1 thiamine pyrophosphate-dependent enzyme [Brevibacterium sp.]MDN5909127.1 thiamine pyrophosphate-dependent enzyme [Brevibacterium sp.]MDN6134769.1 thiamine pyrophosphate-dependent enzyme [Brevibacterium sp.]
MAHTSAHVAQTLSHHISEVFGLMGNGNAYFLDALLTSTSATYTAVRHEAGAVVAADAHFRTSGRIAAATTTYGAGFTNTLTALAEAAQAKVPLVLVVGDEPTSGPRPWDVDQIAMASAVGVRTYTVGRVDAAAATVTAIEHALTYRVPVVLAIPYDVATLDIGEIPSVPGPGHPTPLAPASEFARTSLDRLSIALAEAKRPVLLAGRGAWLAGAEEELGALAEATGALTATTALGRNVFPDSEYDLGVAGGFGAPEAMGRIREADVAVVFGASLNQFTMRFGDLFHPSTSVWQIDTDDRATNARVGGFIRADARLAAAELTSRLETSGAYASGWREAVDTTADRAYPMGTEFAEDGRLDPRAAAARLGEILPEDRVVVSDGGHFIAWANMFWEPSAPDRLAMVGTAFQSIGLGWHSVAGAARANQDSTIVLTTGDGGGAMALSDLDTAIRSAGGRGMAVVFNDAAYGAEVNLYGLKGLNKAPMLIDEIDFAALGSAAGGRGVAVRTLKDLDVFEEWKATPVDERKFLLLDMRISGTIIAPYQEEVIRVNS